jgi:hypothetical protein
VAPESQATPPDQPSTQERPHGHGPRADRYRHRPPLHHRGCAPLRRGDVGAARRPYHQLQGRFGRVRAAGCRVPGGLVAQRHQHRGPEVLPRHPGHTRTRGLPAPGDRPGGRHHHPLGYRGWLLHRRPGGRDLPGRAQAPAGPPEGRLQLPGLVQHRCGRCSPAGIGLLHLVGRRPHGLDPELVPGRGSDLQGWFGCRRQPVPHPLIGGAAQGGWHRVGTGQLHARSRFLGRHHQVGWQDSTCGQDGDPRRRPSRHRRVHLVQVP